MPLELTSALVLIALACACAVSLLGRSAPAATSRQAVPAHDERAVLDAYGVARTADRRRVDFYA